MKNNFQLFIFRLAHGTEKLLRRRPSHFRRDQKQFCIRRMKCSIGSGVIFIGQDPDFSPFFPAHPAIKEKIIASEDKNSIRIPFQKQAVRRSPLHTGRDCRRARQAPRKRGTPNSTPCKAGSGFPMPDPRPQTPPFCIHGSRNTLRRSARPLHNPWKRQTRFFPFSLPTMQTGIFSLSSSIRG